jgi:hypothetical protein
MKIVLLILVMISPNYALAFDETISEENKEVLYKGYHLKYVDLAFKRYLDKKSGTKYKFLLLKENYDFHLTESKSSVVINFIFRGIEFKAKTGRSITGGGAKVIIEKNSNIITSIKMHR